MIRLLLLFTLAHGIATAAAPFIDLSGDWRQSTDDRPDYARPEFDDRAWRPVQLPWTEHRSAAARGVAFWLRRTIELPPASDTSDLVLTLGPVAEVYELYINGALIGATGPFLDDTKAQIAHTRIFPVPPAALTNRAMSIAIRARPVYFGSRSSQNYVGGSYLLSDAARAPRYEAEAMLDHQKVIYGTQAFSAALLFCMSFLILVLWLAERERYDLFWLAVLAAGRGVVDARLFSYISLTGFPFAGQRWAASLFTTGLFSLPSWNSRSSRLPGGFHFG